MNLIPTILNDGTADHTITLRGPVPSKTSVKTEYFEPGGEFVVQTEYAVIPANQKIRRNVIRVNDMLAIDGDGNKSPAAVNISIAHDRRHAESDLVKLVTKALKTLPNVAASTSFVQRLP